MICRVGAKRRMNRTPLQHDAANLRIDVLEPLQRVIDAFERSDWSEIDVRRGDVRIHLAAHAPTRAGPIDPPAVPDPTPATPADLSAPARALGAHLVLSPSPGVFWRSPEPGAPPFADVGQTLDGSATVCIVEVMKLMNHVRAGVAGTVRAVHPENGEMVEHGDPLFTIEPAR